MRSVTDLWQPLAMSHRLNLCKDLFRDIWMKEEGMKTTNHPSCRLHYAAPLAPVCLGEIGKHTVSYPAVIGQIIIS
jgi:hypothetical protein